MIRLATLLQVCNTCFVCSWILIRNLHQNRCGKLDTKVQECVAYDTGPSW
jgi:hypothetical protein